jgi:hypothetical protein
MWGFFKVIFWLVLKLEISYRVEVTWRIWFLIEDVFEDYIFAFENIWVSTILFCLKILFNVNGKAIAWHSSCWDLYELLAVNFENILLWNLQNKHNNFLGCFWWSWTLPKPITLPNTLRDWRHAYQCRWPILNNAHWLHFPTSMMRIGFEAWNCLRMDWRNDNFAAHFIL